MHLTVAEEIFSEETLFPFFLEFFSFFGPLVPWSSNPRAPLVFWSPGPLFFFVPFFLTCLLLCFTISFIYSLCLVFVGLVFCVIFMLPKFSCVSVS